MIRRVNIWSELDWMTVVLYITLVVFGWLNIYAAMYNEKYQSIFDFTQRYGKQMIWIFAAFTIGILTIAIDTKFYTVFSYIIYALTLFLLLLVVFIGKEVNGARSWFSIGGFQMQPTEFAKIGTCLALSKYLSSHQIKLKGFWPMVFSLIPLGTIILLPMFLIGLQPDYGSTLVYVALVLVLYREGLPGVYLVCGFLFALVFILSLLWESVPERIVIMLFSIFLFSLAFLSKKIYTLLLPVFSYIIILLIIGFFNRHFSFRISSFHKHLACVGISMIPLIIVSFYRKIEHLWWLTLLLFTFLLFNYGVTYIFSHLLEEHQRDRIEIFLGQKYDPHKKGYNIEQSKIAIGSGGLMGKGFLQGTQTKFNFVPEQSTDFIFCTVGEEWGFLGSFIMILLFIWLLLRLLTLAERQRSSFGRIYGYGLTCILFIHLSINIGMTIGMFPVVGIPLPFFSYGGSSLWAFTILLFIFLRFDASRMELLR